MDKKNYTAPEVEDFGTVAELTQTGRTQPLDDAKGGSAASNANPS